MQTKKTFHQFQLYIRYYRFYFGNVLIKSFLQPANTFTHNVKMKKKKKLSHTLNTVIKAAVKLGLFPQLSTSYPFIFSTCCNNTVTHIDRKKTVPNDHEKETNTTVNIHTHIYVVYNESERGKKK